METSTILFIYGSETGTAQDVAETLWRNARRLGVTSRLMAMDDYNIRMLPEEKVVIFVVATSGQGEIPTNMRSNWRRLLARQLPDDLLSHVKIAVLGLGDSSYKKFNFAGKKVFRRLLQLGATPLLELGLADDQHQLGVDGVFEPWKLLLWKKLRESNMYGDLSFDFDDAKPLPPKYRLYYTDEPSISPLSSKALSSFIPVEVVSNQRVTSDDHFQDTRLITFSTDAGSINVSEHNSLKYKPGDVLMVQPCNLPHSVEIAIEALELSDDLLDKPFQIIPSDENIPTPPSWLFTGGLTTMRNCLQCYFDLQMVPRRSFLALLSKASEHQMEKERLAELASAEGLDDYFDYCQKPRRTVAELLRDFPLTSASLKQQQFFDVFSTIRARAFSIASSPTAHHLQIQLLVARVVYKVKRMEELRRGLCSNFLCALKGGGKVFAKVRPGTFAYDLEQPLMLIGPGTGIAPFRSMVAENECRRISSSPILLFFGCRSSNKDFYFKNEFEECFNLKLVVAYSRDQPRKIYVQHKIVDHSEQVWKFLRNENAKIFIAGSADEMPKDVLNSLKIVARKNGVQNVEEFFQTMERKNRIQFETWS